MSHKEDKPDYEKKTENLSQNLKAIVNKLTGNDVETKKTTVDTAVKKLECTLANIRQRGPTTDKKELMSVFTDASTAHATFANEVRDVTNYLESKGFAQLQEKRYTEKEIDELVNPKNKASSSGESPSGKSRSGKSRAACMIL